MKELNLNKAIETYDELISNACCENLSINTEYSEVENWNLRDMVAECDYQLSTFNDGSSSNYFLKKDEPEIANDLIKKFKSFIKDYMPYIKDLTCNDVHDSYLDNKVE